MLHCLRETVAHWAIQKHLLGRTEIAWWIKDVLVLKSRLIRSYGSNCTVRVSVRVIFLNSIPLNFYTQSVYRWKGAVVVFVLNDSVESPNK